MSVVRHFQDAVQRASVDFCQLRAGSNIAFNSGEYDPSSADGQRVIAHELAHVRQQTGGRLSMLPQDELELEIDPDPELEREAEEMAQRVMAGGELGIQRLADTEVHVQRYPGQKQLEQAREQITERLQSDEEPFDTAESMDSDATL